MTDAEALAIADRVDLWILNGRDCGPMRTLRSAIEIAMRSGGGARLYRPGDFEVTGVWIEQEQVVRLDGLLRSMALS